MATKLVTLIIFHAVTVGSGGGVGGDGGDVGVRGGGGGIVGVGVGDYRPAQIINVMIFLDAFSHLYKRVCPSVGRSVRRSVGR